MHSKLLGGILLVVGTTIGAGMLALPVATAQAGFYGSLILLVCCWAVMTACAFLFLEVNLWLPADTNIISMAGATLGRAGQGLAWIVYLFLLYSILSAYVAGGGDLFHYIMQSFGIQLDLSLSVVFFTVLLGAVVTLGIKSVDFVNRGLMFGKMGAYLLLVIFIMPFVAPDLLRQGSYSYMIHPTPITVTTVSFGSLLIIPSLRSYFGEDVASLKKAIWIGTLIPLICYIAWNLVIMGVIPLDGPLGLKTILHSDSSTSGVLHSLKIILHNHYISSIAKFFTSICMATSFLSVSLCLSDFLADGLRVKKQGRGKATIIAATFLPPVIIALFYPGAFITGIKYAGICCFILMVLMPPLMAWRGRYHHDLISDEYQVRGGKLLLAVLVIFATLMICFGIESLI